MSLGKLIKQHSVKTIQAMKLPALMEAEVVADPPDLKIKLKGNDKLIIPKELIVVAEHLCRDKRMITITNKGNTDISSQTFSGTTGNDNPVDPVTNTPHVHSFSVDVALSKRNFTLTEGEIQYLNDKKKEDLLKKGDKIMVISFEGGQKFFIIDRIFQY